ncbi:hypothetical protein F5Y19DRAFT_72237 [Xylariaceae sp. FL1651]|nr:hypothetical protein F5Y19DRAFT_72237 [Xylariaceae sp. FL1651]
MSSEGRLQKTTRQPHRKSRNGCVNCKRRRVKCDEQHPKCAKCVQFGVQCSFAPSTTNCVASDVEPSATSTELKSPQSRGRGRPRKNWAALQENQSREGTSPFSVSSISDSMTHTRCQEDLCIDEAELLLQFTQVTAYSLADNAATENSMLHFWSYNLPRIGLTYHFVLHLAYALAAYHLAFCNIGSECKELEYRAKARYHASLGLPQLTQALVRIDKDNCGALYIAATLVCYCTFAAGPAGPGDLLVCNLGTQHRADWLPLIYGVRLIREKFDEDVLFTGLMEPFRGKNVRPETEMSLQDRPARCVREGFARLDWEEPLNELRDFVASQTSEGTEIWLRGLDGLMSIYEATYGDKDATFDGPAENQFVFGWLYRLEKPFVSSLQQRDSTALVILAYYAVLLSTMEQMWYMNGWAIHLLVTVGDLIHVEYVPWLQWPSNSLEQRMTTKYRPSLE